MKLSEKGFTYIELIIALAITVLVVGAAGIAIFQLLKGTEHNNNRVTAVRQVQNAGYWISRDAQMAQSVTAGNLTPPDFLVMTWTEWEDIDNSVDHSVTYFFEDLTDGIGKLKRSHWSSAGANELTLVADNIYYDPGDANNTSKVSYQSPALSVKLTGLSGEARESREYRINPRPNF